MPLFYLPKNRMTLVIICIAVFAYVNYVPKKQFISDTKQTKSESYKNKKNNSKEEKYKVSLAGDNTNFLEKPINALVDKINETKTGNMIFGSFIKSAIEEQLGTSDIDIIEVNSTGLMKYKDIKTSNSGGAAFCNNLVSFKYEVFMPDGSKILNSENEGAGKPVSLVLNKDSVKGLAQSVLGMKRGEVRKVTAPVRMVAEDYYFNNRKIPLNTTVTYLVTLIDFESFLEKEEDSMYLKELIIGKGYGPVCGDRVRIEYSEIKMNKDKNKKKKITRKRAEQVVFTFGETNQVPVGIEKALVGLGVKGSRSVVIPNYLLNLPGEEGSEISKKNKRLFTKYEIKRLPL